MKQSSPPLAKEPANNRVSQLLLIRQRRAYVTDEQAVAVKQLLEKRADRDAHAEKAAALVLDVPAPLPIPKLCRILGLSRPKVWRILRRLHEGGADLALSRRKSPGRPTKRAAVLAYLAQGFTYDETASRFGLHISSVRRIKRMSEAA